MSDTYVFCPGWTAQQRQYQKQVLIYPVILAMWATYLRNNGDDVLWAPGEKPPTYEYKDGGATYYSGMMRGKSGTYYVAHESALNVPFLSLPEPDRILTDAKNRQWQNNGNFRRLPGTYIQSALDCWYAKCTFCRWAKRFPDVQTRPVQSVVDEVVHCVSLGFKEIFDDSGTSPIGDWLTEFCNRMVSIRKAMCQNPFNLGCNMRLVNVDYKLMKKAGYRMVLFGIESANQDTLDKIKKGTKTEDIKVLKSARDAGLEPHITVMFGYPWETEDDAMNTLALVHRLLISGVAKTAQASVFIMDNEGILTNQVDQKYCSKIYDVWKNPKFIFRTITSIKDLDDLRYFIRKVKAGIKEGVCKR